MYNIYHIYHIYNIYTLKVSSSTGPVGTKLSDAARKAKSVSGQTELLWSGAGNGTQGQGADEISRYYYIIYRVYYYQTGGHTTRATGSRSPTCPTAASSG